MGPLSNADTRYFKGDIAFWKDIVAHPNYDEFWQARNILPHLRNIKAAVLVVGGWYDTEDLYGPLRTYAAIEKQNPGIAEHAGDGPVAARRLAAKRGRTRWVTRSSASARARRTRSSRWRSSSTTSRAARSRDLPEALVFETGANRWRSLDAWPPKRVRETRLYFQPRGGPRLPAARRARTSLFDEYVSDPAKPVPYTAEITPHWTKDYMTEDQRFASRRPDVLVYQTEPLEKDLTLAGPLEAELWVSTTGTDADWVVKLVDVNPGKLPGWQERGRRDGQEATAAGQQTLVRGEPFRGRFRESYSRAEAVQAGRGRRRCAS